MSEGAEPNAEGKKDGAWSWLTQTWLGQILSLIALVTAPLAFIESRGFTWTFGIAAIATAFWWWRVIFTARNPSAVADSPRTRTYSVTNIIAAALLPVFFIAATIFLCVYDISKLNIWRSDYPTTTVLVARSGQVNRFFGDQGSRTTPEEREVFDQAEWIRWMESGVQQQYKDKGGQLLFIEGDPFSKRFHTFSLEIYDLGPQVQPLPYAAAFLVSDKRSDAWKRRTIRQIPCDLAGNGSGRLFRVIVENPDPDEYLWLFLPVKAVKSNVDFNALNLQLKVRL